MKKIMLIFMMLGAFALTAQHRNTDYKKSRKELRQNFTPEQKVDLLSKKLTLQLDLSDAQQQQVRQLLLNDEKNKTHPTKNIEEMTPDDKYELRKNQLERHIARKRAFKQIFNQVQFEKWENSLVDRKNNKKRALRKIKPERR